jgi:sulfate transport system ATP-binding protein
VGFEVRLTIEPDQSAQGWKQLGDEVHASAAAEPVSVVLTRTHARSLGVDTGSRVWLTPAAGATTVPAMVAAAV